MEKGKNTKLIFFAIFMWSVVYLIKDIIFHEYKYWQCLNSYELAYEEYLDMNTVLSDNVLQCVKIINKN